MKFVTLDGHRLISEIARGAFSRVFRALDPDGAEVALKLLEDANDKVRVSGLKREYRFLSRLEHPGLPRVGALGKLADGRLYEVMNLLPGDNLRNLLRRKRDWVLSVFPATIKCIGAALGEIHARGIVHCDVKPENVVVGPDGRGYLVDFASARSKSDWYRFWERIPKEASPSYISPEQILGADVTRASDMYSLGIMTFEVLAGRTPFTGMSVKALYDAHLHKPAPLLESVAPSAGKELTRLMASALDKEAERRPVDVAQWCFQVAKCVERLKVPSGARHVQSAAGKI
jgi:serine/threonine protein kinase